MVEVEWEKAYKILEDEGVLWSAWIRAAGGVYTRVYVTPRHVVEDLQDGYAIIETIDDPQDAIEEFRAATIDTDGYEVAEEII